MSLALAFDAVIIGTGLQVEVKDSVGCGDSMAAAIAMGFIQQQSPTATLTLANAGELLQLAIEPAGKICMIIDAFQD